MKKWLTSLTLLFMVINAFSQIRESVCIVRPVYTKEMQGLIDKSSKMLEAAGYSDFARFVFANKNGSFGSGFIVEISGQKYILTNNHVVENADKVDLQFEKFDGQITTYNNIDVIAIDEGLDLALVKFPKNGPSVRGLVLSGAPVYDGQEIWSAGYPGLGGIPSWQLGKGNVTNFSAFIPSLIDPTVSVLIQHSAPVDPGNSGGPLLLPDSSKPSGYSVAGINTWKAFFRQATNFSIPSSTISKFLDVALTTESKSDFSGSLAERSRSFAMDSTIEDDDGTNHRIRKFSKFLGMEFLEESGPDFLLEALNSAPTMVRNELVQMLESASVYEALRFSCAWRIDSLMRTEAGRIALLAPDISTFSVKNGISDMEFLSESGEQVLIRWKLNRNEWELVKIAFNGQELTVKTEPAKTDQNKVADVVYFDFEMPYELSLGLIWKQVDSVDLWDIGIMGSQQYLSYGFYFGASGPVEDSVVPIGMIEMFGTARLQLPLSFRFVTFLPYLSVSGGLRFGMGMFDGELFVAWPVIGGQLVFSGDMSFYIDVGYIPADGFANLGNGTLILGLGLGRDYFGTYTQY